MRLGVAAAAMGVPRLAACGTRLAASETAWIDESIASAGRTGEWSQEVLYNRTTRIARLDGEYVFTPFVPSSGKFVTVEFTTTFPANDYCGPLDADAQAAVRLWTNGCFQVWTARNWLDVAARGVAPVADVEYSISFVFDYDAGVYSASVKDSAGQWVAFQSEKGAKTFPLAGKKKEIESITFEGKTRFRSLKGSQTDETHSGKLSDASLRVADPVENPIAPAMTSQTPSEFGWAQKPWSEPPSEFRRRFLPSSQAPPEFGWRQKRDFWLRRNLDGGKNLVFRAAGIWTEVKI